MEFRSDREVTILAGFATALMGAINLFIVFAFAQEGVPWFYGLLGGLLIVISAVCFTYSKVVRIDAQRKLVEKTIRVLSWEKKQTFTLSNFRGVGIATAGGGGRIHPNVKYFVHLLGPENMSIPGFENKYEHALIKAKRIAEFLNLPLDEKPKIAFFGHRL
jgi:hypothetical protein